MITILKNVLSKEELIYINSVIDSGQFYPGAETAGWAAQSVKNNLQWRSTPNQEEELSVQLTHILVSHTEFATSTYAKTVAPFLFSESRDSGGYGNHVDDALMGAKTIIRSDMSCTVFLNNPEDYSGGELVMDLGGTELSYKLPMGHAIIYPSTTLHRVEPVTKGVRRVGVTWLESYIRHSEQRNILNDLDFARRDVMKVQGKSVAFDKISQAHANLLRCWAET